MVRSVCSAEKRLTFTWMRLHFPEECTSASKTSGSISASRPLTKRTTGTCCPGHLHRSHARPQYLYMPLKAFCMPSNLHACLQSSIHVFQHPHALQSYACLQIPIAYLTPFKKGCLAAVAWACARYYARPSAPAHHGLGHVRTLSICPEHLGSLPMQTVPSTSETHAECELTSTRCLRHEWQTLMIRSFEAIAAASRMRLVEA